MIEIDEHTLSIIDGIADTLAPYFTFGYYDTEDIKQEIRVMCLEALPRFDEDKASLKTFLTIHSRNRLITLKRDKLCRIFPPCYTCKSWDNECNKYINKSNCAKYAKWSRTTNDKHSLFALSELSDNDIYYNTNVTDDLCEQELFEYIDEHIPVKYRQDYLNYIENGKMTTYAKQNIRRIIQELAKDYVM